MGWWLPGAIAAGVVGATLGACGTSNEYTCHSDAQCTAEDPGQCQPAGYCSFPTEDCASGQRYGEHSGPYAGRCVDASDDDVAGTYDTSSTSTSDASGEATSPVLTTSEPTTADETTGPPVDGTTASSEGEASSSEGTTGEPLDPDLVLWLELERAPAGAVLDSSSFMSHGACRVPECPEGAPGVLGQGVHHDGIDDAVVVPNAPQLETLDGLTVAVWIRLDEPPMEHRAVLTKPVGMGQFNSWELHFSSVDHMLHFAVTDGVDDYDVALPEPLPLAQWVHLAGTWDGSVVTLWVDGEPVGSVDGATIAFDDQPVLVGADDDHEGGPSGYYGGGMDDVRVYRRALTAEEVGVLAVGGE